MNESSEEFDYSKIKAELETLREKLEALETKQATFKTSTHPTVRRRFAKKLIIASIPLAAIVVAAGLLWGQDAIKALFIDKDGNVGIGRQSPGAKLDVLGTTRLTNGTGDSAFPWTDGNSYVSGTNVIFRSNGNTPQMILTNTGKLGIRTQSPSYPLDVRGEFRVVNDDTNLQGFTGYWKSSYATIGSYNWKDSKYEPLRVDGSVLSLNSEGGGNVGIGTTDPKAKLDVRGDLIVNGMVNATQTNPMRNGMYPN